jgi:hypothetical protein
VRFTRVVLQLSSLAYAIVGVSFLAAPAVMASLIDVVVSSATADNDVRAVYGGVASGLAVFFWLAASRPEWFRPALVAQVLTMGGLAGARFVSWAAVGLPEPIGFGLHLCELVGFGAGIAALRRNRAAGHPA